MAARPRRSLPQLPDTTPTSSAAGGRRIAKTPSTSSLLDGGSSQQLLLLPSQASVLEAGAKLAGPTSRRSYVSPVKFTPPGEGEDSSVTVAVRVRPFSDRELRLEAKQVVRMHGNETIITSREGVVHRFFYDHCFWSFDTCPQQQAAAMANQRELYHRLAQPLLDRSFEGFNTCLFAYGQTGSGKSYCIMGEGEELGVVPQFAKELYGRVEVPSDPQVTFHVQVSFFEIYKEKIYDLLASTTHKNRSKLRVREHPVLGPYVEDLSTYTASSYSDIERWLTLGNRFRATATTGMNDRSSRSHSVFTIMLTQTSILEGEEHSKVSRINLIDLAGSERSSVSQTAGERLKEGASINRSLHTLGKVISLLSEKSTGKRRKVYVPYRDSTLTWLLKDSLGGNSKTTMIATISPADLHYSESLSTLRYAQQARTIVNVARINEDPNARIIRDLRQEIDHLRQLLGEGASPGSSLAELRERKEQLKESEKLMADAKRSWQEKLAETEARKQEELEQLTRSGALLVNNRLPSLVNLSEDAQLSEVLLYVLKVGVTTVGRSGGEKGEEPHDIELAGTLILKDHCTLVNEESTVTLNPSPQQDDQIFVNGDSVTEPTVLHHGDRVVLGGEYFFRFNNLLEAESVGGGASIIEGTGGFEFARNELIKSQTIRLEADLEKKRLEDRQRMMEELQFLKTAAQEEMDRQKSDYESKLQDLEEKIDEQSMEVTMQLKSVENTENKIEELVRKNELLQEETVAQKHIIQLEKLNSIKEYEEMKESKTRIMSELEQERNKLQDDIHKLQQIRQNDSKQEPLSAASEALVLERGAELVRISMMLQEASAICKGLNRPLTFSRDEVTNEMGELEFRVRVTNTSLGLMTYWDFASFEVRLDQMRDIYHSNPTAGSTTSLETESTSSSLNDESDPFHDPSDIWVKDTLITPLPSPHRTNQLQHSLFSNTGSPASFSATSTQLQPKSLTDMLSASVGSRGFSPSIGTPDDTKGTHGRATTLHSLSQSLPRVCYENITHFLNFSEVTNPMSAFQKMIQYVSQMRNASLGLEQDFAECKTPGFNVPFSETTLVRHHTLSLYSSLELMFELARSLHEHTHAYQTLLHSGQEPPDCGTSLIKHTCLQLQKTLSHQTALYCSKLLQAIENEGEDAIKESCGVLQESLNNVTLLTGQLCLARCVQERAIFMRLNPSQQMLSWSEDSGTLGSEDFLSLQLYQGSALTYFRGHCEWCTLSIEAICHNFQTFLKTLREASVNLQPQTLGAVLMDGVGKVVTTTRVLLQRLGEMQVEIWNLDTGTQEVGTLPLTPNIHHVIDMLIHLEQVDCNTHSLCKHLLKHSRENHDEKSASHKSSMDKLSISNGRVILSCNEFAASVLSVITSSPCCDSAQSFSMEVQSLLHEVARAGKTLNHLLKSGLQMSLSTPIQHNIYSHNTPQATSQVLHAQQLPKPLANDDSDDSNVV